MSRGERQQLIVTAHYADGSTRDVTHLAAFQANEDAIAAVDDNGMVTSENPLLPRPLNLPAASPATDDPLPVEVHRHASHAH